MQFANFYLILPAFFALYTVKHLSVQKKAVDSLKKIKKKIKARIIHSSNAT